jgi:hypothetical protein
MSLFRPDVLPPAGFEMKPARVMYAKQFGICLRVSKLSDKQTRSSVFYSFIWRWLAHAVAESPDQKI